MSDRLTGLVPRPVSVRPRPGTVALATAPAPAAASRDADLARTLTQALAAVPWPDPPSTRAGPAPLTVESARDLAPEAYRLAITPAGLSVAAGGPPGAFYAAQTIRQLLPDAAWRAAPIRPANTHDWHLPCAMIDDAPALSWRGAHLDVARHFFPKRELLALIDAFAALKLNRLHLHLTDDQGWRIESRIYPVLHEIGSHRPRTRLNHGSEHPPVYDGTPHGGFYTLADLAEIAAYAARRMITVVPEIEVPGHASALLAARPDLGAGTPPPGGYQVLADWGIFPYLMSPLPATRDFLRDVFGELLDAVPAPYVHIGGDECVLDAWRDDPAIDSYRRQRGLAGPEELHAAFLREVADLLAGDFGARAVVWDEGFASADGTPQRLRADTIVMAWRGTAIARRAAVAGHDVIAAPVLPTYFDYYQSDDAAEPAGIGGPVRLADVAAFEPVPGDWPEAAREHLIGTQFQVWTEYIATTRELEYMIFPRACALADVAWSGAPVGPGELDARLAAQLRRLDAAGLGYRPLDGPAPGHAGGTGRRAHRRGTRISDVVAHLDDLAAGGP
jgi:hexosaminidase